MEQLGTCGVWHMNKISLDQVHEECRWCQNWQPVPVPAEPSSQTEEEVREAKFMAGKCICARGYASTCPVHGSSVEGAKCPECDGVGRHRELFVKTGQSGFGEVDGYFRECRTGKLAESNKFKDVKSLVSTAPAEPVAGETKPGKVQSALRGIRDIVKGRCNHLDLEVIREIINEAIGHEQV